jgi:hypothetical protein
MSLFASLHPLAQKTTLTLSISTEGDQLRVNATPSVAFRLCLLGMFVPMKVPADVVCKVPEPA